MEERLRDAAAFARRCGQLCTVALMEPLAGQRSPWGLSQPAGCRDAARRGSRWLVECPGRFPVQANLAAPRRPKRTPQLDRE